MKELITMPVHTPGSVEDYFLIEGHILSTRSADAYKALDKATKESLCLWKLRHPLAVNSDAVRRFLNRLAAIGDFDPPVCDMTTYGVDAAGVAFAVFPPIPGQSITQLKVDVGEAERIFFAILRTLEPLHSEGIVCGDLCGNSICVDRTGDVSLIGVMGSFDTEAAATSMLPPMDTLHFVAPEQREGGGAEPATDVFALGILGYHLFTGTFPFGPVPPLMGGDIDLSRVKPATAWGSQIPKWTDEVLLKCIDPSPAKRYQSAGEIRKVIAEVRQRLTEESKMPSRSKETKKQEKVEQAFNAPISSAKKPKVEEEADVSAVAPPPRSRLKAAVLMAGLFFLILIIGLKLTAHPVPQETKLQADLKLHLPAVDSDQMKQAIVEISEPKTALVEKEIQLEKIVNSDDPLSHAILVQTAIDAPTAEERALAERAVLSRAQRLNLKRSAEQVRQWLRANGTGVQPQGYGAILRTLDTTLPLETHSKIILEAYPTNPRIILRLVAALALDSQKLEEYQPLLARLLSETMPPADVTPRSTIALILGSSELSTVFGEDAIELKDRIRTDDIMWLLRVLADRNDVNIGLIADLAAQRKVLSPLRETFLSVANGKKTVPIDVLSVLVKGASGVIKKADLATFGRWYDPDAERVLMAVCADDYDDEVVLEAFDILAGKGLTLEPSATLVGIIKKSYWEKRAEFVRAIGILGNVDKFEDAKVKKALTAFAPYDKDPQLIKALLASNTPLIVREGLSQFPERVGLSELLGLLSIPDAQTKILALKALAAYNDIGALKLIIDAYEKESDPAVRKVYEDTFWVIKQRSSSNR